MAFFAINVLTAPPDSATASDDMAATTDHTLTVWVLSIASSQYACKRNLVSVENASIRRIGLVFTSRTCRFHLYTHLTQSSHPLISPTRSPHLYVFNGKLTRTRQEPSSGLGVVCRVCLRHPSALQAPTLNNTAADGSLNPVLTPLDGEIGKTDLIRITVDNGRHTKIAGVDLLIRNL